MFDHVYFSVCLGSKFDLRELQKLAGEGDYQASAPNFKQVTPPMHVRNVTAEMVQRTKTD